MTRPDQRIFTLPPTTITAVVVGGVLVSVFTGAPYKRRINSLVVNCATTSAVEVYRGLIAQPSLIAVHPVGNQNTYMPPNRDEIPAGYPVFVRWPSAVSGLATATIVFEGYY